MRNAKSKVLAASTVALSLVVLAGGPAMAGHFNGYDAVDNREIRYVDHTKYNTALANAIEQWNKIGGVDFKKDTSTTSADLVFVDIDSPTMQPSGQFVYHSAPGKSQIRINERLADTYGSTSGYTKNVFLHEMGHALGLGDHTSTKWNSVMYYKTRGWITVGSHDRADYHDLWG